ncbi:MAG: GGDEF domain-containing protein [Acidimicrobiales bacterium]|jgi:diguanylate cyclase (GGDEF)-like protein/PAS domain S-box-containing protein
MEPVRTDPSHEPVDESVVRGRLVYAGGGALDTLCRSVLGSGELGFLAMTPDGVIVFINAAMGRLIGRSPAECIGRNVTEWLHPDELERAGDLMSVSTAERPPPGMSRFMIAHSNGQWVPLEISGTTAWDGSDRLLAIYCRNGAPRLAIEEVMTMLLHGLPLTQVLAAVCNVIEWDGYGTHVAISWFDGQGFQQVGTGVPDEIGGGDASEGSIWERSRLTGKAMLGTSAELDPDRQAMARGLGVSEVWVVPVAWEETRPPATITIWTIGSGRSPQIHAYGMEVARNMVELILRWNDQQMGLERAAHLDALTGIANRRVFFNTLAAGVEGGAILYCDLDRFKPVNDTLGHAAGDEVLRVVAKRIANCVRSGDLVARLGGDEFAVLCEGASPSDATEVASRIEAALDHPFLIDGSEITVGVSIGIAHSLGPLNEALVDAADTALAEAKAAGRSTFRVAP